MFERMKTSNYFILLILLIISCQKKQQISEISIINWEFREQGAEWLPAKVPGFVHLDLYDNDLIEDPFYRDNENKVQWIEEKVWEYKAEFALDSEFLKNKSITLNLSGIDTYADIYLNDSLIITSDNFFVSYAIEVSSYLKFNNKLQVIFKPTQDIARQKDEKSSYNLPGEHRVHVRKPQFHFGWDWGPKLIGCGITEEVKLIASNTAQISDFFMSTLSINDSISKMRLELEISNHDKEEYFVQFLGKTYSVESESTSIDFALKNAKLWWPRGYGKQHLQELQVNLLNKDGVLIDQLNEQYAIRKIDLIQEEKDLGKTFKFQVNGQDLYAKGANWIPLDFFHTRVDSIQYRNALKDVTDANMNMLRVWGGGIYENDYFYDLCDSLGILIWQDFMFACAMYPGDDEFMSSVELEATQQIKRLRNHPSIALWCGNNETSEGWHNWGWQADRSDNEIDSIWQDYLNLFSKLLPGLVDSYSTTAYWESSPQYGRGNPKHQFSGDAHYWGIWHDAEPFENFESKVPRFMSEYGFQSFPEMKTIELYALEEDFYLDSKVMKTHQKHPRGNSLIQEYMLRDYREPNDFESFVYLSQVLQAEGMRIGIEAHRRARPYNMGTLYWQFNDCWPVASWSSRDYYGNWKALHYTTKRAYEDLLISTVQTKDSVSIYLINDESENYDYDLLIEHVDYNGNRMKIKSKNIIANGASSNLIETIALDDFLNIDSIENKSYLDLQVLQSGEVKTRKLHHFVKTKEMNLTNTKISYKVEKDSLGFVLEILSGSFMKNVMINSLHDGRFEDNYFDLPANEHKQIRFYNDYPMEGFNTDNLTFFSIVDSYE